MNEEIYEKVIACIEDACEMEFTDITASSRLREDLQMDSLKMIMFQIRLEDEFAFSFDPMEEMADIFFSVESVFKNIENR